MANTAMGGFRWARSKIGAKTEPRERGVVITANSGAIFRGDAVKRVSDGTFIVCAAGDAVYGIADGVERYKNSSSQIVSGNYLPDATAYSGTPTLDNPQASVIYIIPCRDQVFEVDVNTAATTLTTAQDLVGNNADLVATAGSTASGRSGFVLNTASGSGTGTAQFQILEIVQMPGNDVTAVNWKALVQVNEGNEPPFTATGV